VNNYFADMFPAVIIGVQLFLYALLFLYYRHHWHRSLLQGRDAEGEPRIFFSIIIPARNEEHNISACLRSILKLNYPSHLYEVIVVDDHSHDLTADIVKSFPQVILIHLSDIISQPTNSYKKLAISAGIHQSKGDYIVTTDADSEVSPDWLRRFDQCIQNQNAVLVAAPVSIHQQRSLLNKFESLDFMMLQAITAAAVHSGVHSMANGANLCYRKMAFEEVDGFKQIDDIASGDDMLLLQKIAAKYPDNILYCHSKEAMVTTAGASSVRAFIDQRIRWASKGKYYQSAVFKIILLFVYLFNLSMLVFFMAGFWNSLYMTLFLTAILLKTGIELILLIPASQFYNQRHLLWYFMPLQPLHILYMVIAGTFGNIGKYHWKGRLVR
jgi:cellulose synthase/poly-beta-1,6-N-acetylglucosamine synthase-like glycosyltransferase